MDTEQIRGRLKDLNTKAYYLLIALTFAYGTKPGLPVKLAFTLTALVAVLPVQDWAKSSRTLEAIRRAKVALLVLALGCTLWWVWSGTSSPTLPTSHSMDMIFTALTAIGTLAVAVTAIWGDWLRSRLVAPHVEIQVHNPPATLTRFSDGRRVIYYHLKAINKRSWAVARNCRVILTTIYLRNAGQDFQPARIPVPPQFVWAPAELTPIVIDLSGEHVIDFGRIPEDASHFEPVLYSYAHDFKGLLRPNQAIRYELQAFSGGSPLGPSVIYEVEWNGQWSENLDMMRQYLSITSIEKTPET